MLARFREPQFTVCPQGWKCWPDFANRSLLFAHRGGCAGLCFNKCLGDLWESARICVHEMMCYTFVLNSISFQCIAAIYSTILVRWIYSTCLSTRIETGTTNKLIGSRMVYVPYMRQVRTYGQTNLRWEWLQRQETCFKHEDLNRIQQSIVIKR